MGRHSRQEVEEHREQPALHSTNVPAGETNKPSEAGCLALQDVREEGTNPSRQMHSELTSSLDEGQEQFWLRIIEGETHSEQESGEEQMAQLEMKHAIS